MKANNRIYKVGEIAGHRLTLLSTLLAGVALLSIAGCDFLPDFSLNWGEPDPWIEPPSSGGWDSNPPPQYRIIYGTVRDEQTQQAIEGATVKVVFRTRQYADVSDSLGAFELAQLPNQVVTLTAEKVGYDRFSQKILISYTDSLNLVIDLKSK